MDCNRFKGNAWPNPQLARLGFRFLNPCLDNITKHWSVGPDGVLDPKSFAGEYMIARLRLNRQTLRDWRREKTDLLAAIQDANDAITLAAEDAPVAGALRRLHIRLLRQFENEYAAYWT